MNQPSLRRHVLAHWFGCGLCPVAPGTVGSLGAVPLHLLLCRLAPGWHLLVTLGLTGLGLWAAERASRTAQTEDPQQVVIDEVVGTLLAMGLVRDRGLVAAGLALLAFRVLDITKPGIIDRVQRLKPNGLGIMADDVLAGLVAGLGTRLLSGLWLR